MWFMEESTLQQFCAPPDALPPTMTERFFVREILPAHVRIPFCILSAYANPFRTSGSASVDRQPAYVHTYTCVFYHTNFDCATGSSRFSKILHSNARSENSCASPPAQLFHKPFLFPGIRVRILRRPDPASAFAAAGRAAHRVQNPP